MRVGITGHMDLAGATAVLVRAAVDRLLADWPRPLTGVSCLAFGADQIFAEAVLDAGGALEVVLPSADYRVARVWPELLPKFDALVERALSVEVMPFTVAGPEAYAAANDRVLGSVDRMIAVWDGSPAAKRGGTADAVAEAERQGVPVTVIWPEGARRARAASEYGL
jgi:hypothetical protein